MKGHEIKIAGRGRFAKGVTLIEMAVTAAIAIMPVVAVGVMITGSQRSWRQMHRAASSKTESQGHMATALFGAIGRRSYSDNCEVYSAGGGNAEISAVSNGVLFGSGEEVEFGYWQDGGQSGGGASSRSPLRTNRSREISRVEPNRYARFYLDAADDKLKVDRGYFPYKTQTITAVLAENVTGVRFSRTTMNNTRQACVRMEMTLVDPADEVLADLADKKFTIMATTLLRN